MLLLLLLIGSAQYVTRHLAGAAWPLGWRCIIEGILPDLHEDNSGILAEVGQVLECKVAGQVSHCIGWLSP